ncbi:centrosomal protein of 85 kDa isoform X2 [Lingula anatina]|uniref:Centrosomal protein of 85 kDa isoform X2 n=1 Tax=Lingula anatina TaxID=7574 RepID=A0A1S3HGG2_LINAN|nr:centrosomal protein of 85 kDa isoform X2 [Lingula anatina]|eukprot:XP_013385155.1 centrosomal protein of 85 kDa isoform X2 [Lingula anatina]
MLKKGFLSPLKSIYHSVQTNVPDYQKMIEQQNETRGCNGNYVTPPGPSNRPNYSDFATPKLSVIKTRVKRTGQQVTTRHGSYSETIPHNASAPQIYSSHGINMHRSSSTEFLQHCDLYNERPLHITRQLGSTSSLPQTDYVEKDVNHTGATLSSSKTFSHGHQYPTSNMNKPQGPAFNQEVLHSAQNHHGYSTGQIPRGATDGQDFGEPRRYYPTVADHAISQHQQATKSSSLPNSPRHSHMPHSPQIQNNAHQVPAGDFYPNNNSEAATSTGHDGGHPLHSTPVEDPGGEGGHYPSQSSHGYTLSSMTSGQSSIASATVNDLTQWQQQHQHQLLRQRFSMTKTTDSGPLLGAEFPSMASNDSTHKWDALKRVADSIIKEKDMIIERQRMKIMQVEQQSKDYEGKLHRALQTQADRDGDILSIKLQEMQYDNASLKAHLAEITSSKDQQIEELQRKLGETEYNLQELKTTSKNDAGVKSSEIENLKAKLSQKEDTILHWKEKYNEIEDKFSESRNKVKSLEHYLEDLPTADEYLSKKKEMRSMREDLLMHQEKIKDLEGTIVDLKRTVKYKDEMIEAMEKQEANLTSKVAKLEVDLLQQVERVAKLKDSSTLIKVEQDLQQTKQEKELLVSNLDKAKKLLENKHKKQKQMEIKHQSEIKQLEERISQEESSVLALKEELGTTEKELRKVRQTMKEINKQNQDLMEDSMTLRDKVKEAEKLTSAETKKLEQRLLKEMQVCFSDLQSLVQICMEQAEGQDPNMSVLLGVRAPSVADSEEEQTGIDGAMLALKHKISSVKDLRQDIDKLREIMSNKYAEEMGENLHCATQ